MFVYLDNGATTRPYPQVAELVSETMMEQFGNPSAMHRLGIQSERVMKAARKQMAQALHSRENELYFVSGGTESDNTAVLGTAEAKKRTGKRIVTTRVEHPAVYSACQHLERQGFEVIYVGVDALGRVRMEEMERAVNDDTILISVMHVNNELGTIQPIREIGRLKRANTWFHVDAVQSFGKEPMDLSSDLSCVDLLSISGHKFHGPRGTGLLYVRDGIHLPSLIYGGGQEAGLRSGTENTPAIAGMALAAETTLKNREAKMEHISRVRQHLLENIKTELSDVRINSPLKEGCSPSILNISFLGCRGEVLLHTLEQHDIYVSTGSACSSKKKGNRILEAAGLNEQEIEGTIRFSFCEDNTTEEMDYVVQHLKQAVESQRRLRGAMGKKRR